MFYVINRYDESMWFRGSFESCTEWLEARGLTEDKEWIIDWID